MLERLKEKEVLEAELANLKIVYEGQKAKNYKIDMRRGKPDSSQLDLSNDMLDQINDNFINEKGIDIRNYGGDIEGLPEARRLFAQILEISPDEVIVGGNSSLNIMYDCIVRALLLGVYGAKTPWGKQEKVKFLCPSPGYDRHFGICEQLGIDMVTIPMLSDGPDMDLIESYVNNDHLVKGVWNIPKYSNPEGITYSDEVVRRFANLHPAADDFRIFWDNAYAVHHFYPDKPDILLNLADECKKAGNPHIYYIFASTSKITYAGAGIAAIASSKENIKHLAAQINIQTITPDKINQMNHCKFLKDIENINSHMAKHAAFIRPKFEKVRDVLQKELEDIGYAKWNNPRGGYFISLNLMDGCATKTVAMAAQAGVMFTGAGATFPYGKDPKDSNIRIAPTMPSLDELEAAMNVLCTCIKIVCIEKLLTE